MKFSEKGLRIQTQIYSKIGNDGAIFTTDEGKFYHATAFQMGRISDDGSFTADDLSAEWMGRQRSSEIKTKKEPKKKRIANATQPKFL